MLLLSDFRSRAAVCAKDLNRYWTETTYDGEEDSDLLTVPPHWHKHHDEILEVLSGRMKFHIAGKEFVGSADDGPITVTRGCVHSFTAIKGEKVTMREMTNHPSGDFKALFFQDLFQEGNPSFFMVMRAFYDGDGYLSLPGNIKLLDELFITIVGFLSKAFVPVKPTVVKRKGDETEASGSFRSRGGLFT